jgi:hypothetical protein
LIHKGIPAQCQKRWPAGPTILAHRGASEQGALRGSMSVSGRIVRRGWPGRRRAFPTVGPNLRRRRHHAALPTERRRSLSDERLQTADLRQAVFRSSP